MPIFYKLRGQELPTVIFHGDHIYDFVRVAPDLFEFETEDPVAVAFLTKLGFQTKEPDENPVPETVAEPALQAVQPMILKGDEPPPPKPVTKKVAAKK